MHRLPTTTGLSTDVVWHGHTEDLARLVESADAFCSCGRGVWPPGVPCGAHQILADQHTLDHLAFARSVLQRLIQEEWRVPAPPESRAEKAEWSAFLHVCTAAREPVRVRAAGQPRSPRAAALGPWVVSLVALVLLLGVRGPGGVAMPSAPWSTVERATVQPLASWQTR